MWLQMSQSVEGTREARHKAAHELETMALQAVQAVPTAEAVPLWLLAYKQAAALGSNCRQLNQTLLQQLTAVPTGPLRVNP